MHHRVKNNLQIISSVIYLQSQRIEDPKVRQIFEDSQSRISSMALVQDNLYRSQNLSRINLSEYIQTLTASLFYTYRIQPDLVQLKLKVDDSVLVSLDKAIPCGLVLNELMTNALKHGFSDGKTGEIAVTLEKVSALLNRSMKHRFYPHPSPLPKGEGTGILAPFSPGRRVGEGFAPLREEGISYLHSATPKCRVARFT
ncbi:MAG: sensor histidine kinase [Phormidesmis sp. CAN_BIN44]|nr:sensor histidine kinase [Phormidesmis sp. CAN_BIN44]